VHQVNIRARYLRFSILSGHGEFATVNRYASRLTVMVTTVCQMEAGTQDQHQCDVHRVSVVGESLTGDDAGHDDDEVGDISSLTCMAFTAGSCLHNPCLHACWCLFHARADKTTNCIHLPCSVAAEPVARLAWCTIWEDGLCSWRGGQLEIFSLGFCSLSCMQDWVEYVYRVVSRRKDWLHR
jgi:hypothetical protein